ncbi:uncharacterized protein [Parasteatoda tepidariorum]|uniref:uncharacterized protein n=1 Tax=Parasteatoda tepidariorum TaxID=114398 RepID=UPI00077F8980|nr:uncharacterized protein LOC107439187 [Parasteatoda tepidariorum]
MVGSRGGKSKGGRCTLFNIDALKQRDCNGDLISDWCTPGFKPEEGICTIRDLTIKCNQHGVSAAGKIKPKIVQKRLDFTQKNCQQLGEKDKVTAAETFFTLAVAKCNVPFMFSDTATEIFPKMFSDSKIASEFSVSRTKLSYIVSDGIGPFLKSDLIHEINKYGAYYSIQIDETPIQEKRTQQLDVLIRFYSEMKQKVLTKHLQSFHLGHATSDILLDCVKRAISELSSQKLISFYSDGLNVMKALKKKMSLINENLIDISECSLHKVHNGFSEGLNAFGGDIECLVIDIYHFFKNSASSNSDFRDVQIKLNLPENVFVWHVSSRWLTVEASVGRFIEQYDALKFFFITSPTGRQSARHQRILCALRDKSTYAKALFLQNVCPLFSKYLAIFQSQEPLIPILYDEMVAMLKALMGRFLVSEAFADKTGIQLKELDVNSGKLWKKPEVGCDTQKELKKLDETVRKECYLGARAFYITSAKYLLKVLPLGNKFLERLKCIHPEFIKEESSLGCIKAIARELPNIISHSSVTSLADEWIVLQSEAVPVVCESSSEGFNIQHYWNSVFSLQRNNSSKFPYVQVLVKALLALPHGNADCERGFSINNALNHF